MVLLSRRRKVVLVIAPILFIGFVILLLFNNNKYETSSGFVLFNGKYLDVPYKINITNDKVLLNGIVLATYLKENAYNIKVYEEPEFPKHLNESSRLQDLDRPNNLRYDGEMWLYLSNNCGEDVARIRMIDYYNKMPFVKEAKQHPYDKDTIVVEELNGEISNLSMDYRPGTENVGMDPEEIANYYLERLNKNDCYLIFKSGMEMSYGIQGVKKELTKIVDILNKYTSEKERIKALRGAGIINELNEKSFEIMARNYVKSNELENRLKNLLNIK